AAPFQERIGLQPRDVDEIRIDLGRLGGGGCRFVSRGLSHRVYLLGCLSLSSTGGGVASASMASDRTSRCSCRSSDSTPAYFDASGGVTRTGAVVPRTSS